MKTTSYEGVLILGAGLSGLGCARGLPGARVREAQDHPGGRAYSHVLDGLAFDEGAHICHSRDAAWLELVGRAAGDVELIAQSRVSNWWHGHWVTYPVQNHLHDLPPDVRLAALADFVRAQVECRDVEPRHYLEWCLSHYGRYLTEQFYALYTRKYWRMPMEELATDWLAGRLMPSQVERILAGALGPQEEQQSTFAAFRYPARGGFYAFTRALFEAQPIACGKRAVAIDPARRRVAFADGSAEEYECLASSVPLPELVGMTAGAPPAAQEAARRLRWLQLLTVNLVVRRPDLAPFHWFYLYDQDLEAARVSLPSRLAPRAAPAGATVLQAEVFRRHDEAPAPPALAEQVARDLGRVLGFPAGDAAICGTVAVPCSYVISDRPRAAAVEFLHHWLEERDIYPMGLGGGWRFIWSDAAFRSGEETARRIARRLGGGAAGGAAR